MRGFLLAPAAFSAFSPLPGPRSYQARPATGRSFYDGPLAVYTESSREKKER